MFIQGAIMTDKGYLDNVKKLFARILEDIKAGDKKWDVLMASIAELSEENKNLKAELEKLKKPD